MKLPSSVSAVAVCLSAVTPAFAADAPTEALAQRARTVLVDALNTEKVFVKVHAAEALISLGDKETPHRVFAAELPAANDIKPYRIGVWRVLAGSSATPQERAEWIARTEAVSLDPTTMDRLHSIESLCKLGHVASAPVRAAVESMAKAGTDAEAVFPRWLLHLAGDRTALPAIVATLASEDPAARLRAAYVLRWLKIDDPATRAAIARTADKEPATAIGYPYILGAAVQLNADPARVPVWVTALEKIIADGATGARYDACQTLMLRYKPADLARLVPLLDHPDGDARIGAAWAILYVMKAKK